MIRFDKYIMEKAESYKKHYPHDRKDAYGMIQHSFIAGANAAQELMQEKLDVAVEALEWYNSVYKKSVFVKEIGTAFSDNALNKIRGGK